MKGPTDPEPRTGGDRGNLDPISGLGEQSPTLVIGKSPLERESVARAVHRQQKGQDGLFLRLRCPQDTELLEHALDKWLRRPEGEEPPHLLTRLDGGSLFLDEIEALSPRGQALLLEFLQRVGAKQDTAAGARPWRGQFIVGSMGPLRRAAQETGFLAELASYLERIRIVLDPEEHPESR